ncbi:shikimate kinase [Alkalibacterium olivapovliticus]|uniref:Shikimate kinase n=2 Tax=Alkalibacterium olivapovliticus TaxID=99907 RepID=A0A2T0W6H3_9LACT|nr:shikimate kinase [Alkalibacterium olivapovliticus]
MAMSNLVLIGMTGSGKTTIGKELSRRLPLSFIDMDEYIEAVSGFSIPELFKKGEEPFRSLETDACKALAAKKNSIISTGGGAVVKEANHQWLKKTGLIIWIDRPVRLIADDIQIEHRPLLKDGTDVLCDLYKEREKIYRQLADIIVINDRSLEETIDSLIEQLPKQYRKGDVS